MYLQYILAEIHSLFAFINIDTLVIQRCHHIFLSSRGFCERQRSFPYTDDDPLARWLPATRTQCSLTIGNRKPCPKNKKKTSSVWLSALVHALKIL